MLAIIVLILQLLRCRLNSGVDRLCTISHFATSSSTTALWTASLASLPQAKAHGSCTERQALLSGPFAQTFELVDNQVSGIFLVSVLDFFLCQAAHAGNRTVDIICMGGSVAGECLFPPVPNW